MPSNIFDMTLSDLYLKEIRVKIAGPYVDSIAALSSIHGKFEATDRFDKLQHFISKKLNALIDRCELCIAGIEDRLHNSHSLDFMTRHKLNSDLRDMRTLNVYETFNKMITSMMDTRELPFPDKVLSGINIKRNNITEPDRPFVFTRRNKLRNRSLLLFSCCIPKREKDNEEYQPLLKYSN